MTPINGVKCGLSNAAPPSLDEVVFARREVEMKRQLETATDAPAKLESRVGGELTPELLTGSELVGANDAGLQAPDDDAVSVLERQAARTQTRGLPALRLLWAKRQIMLRWAKAGCGAAVMPPDAQPTRSFGGFGSIAGDLLGVSTTSSLLVALIGSRTVEDRMIDRFNLKQVLGVVLQQDAYKRLKAKTGLSVDGKNGIVVLSVTDNDPQRAAAMAREFFGYIRWRLGLATANGAKQNERSSNSDTRGTVD
jgi:hypothetical protein